MRSNFDNDQRQPGPISFVGANAMPSILPHQAQPLLQAQLRAADCLRESQPRIRVSLEQKLELEAMIELGISGNQACLLLGVTSSSRLLQKLQNHRDKANASLSNKLGEARRLQMEHEEILIKNARFDAFLSVTKARESNQMQRRSLYKLLAKIEGEAMQCIYKESHQYYDCLPLPHQISRDSLGIKNLRDLPLPNNSQWCATGNKLINGPEDE